MLKDKKPMLKSSKKPSEDSSSEEQRVREKKVEESSSSEIPKRRNLKPRCLAIKLKAAEDVAKESERPVLTQRGEDDTEAVEIYVVKNDVLEAELKKTKTFLAATKKV